MYEGGRLTAVFSCMHNTLPHQQRLPWNHEAIQMDKMKPAPWQDLTNIQRAHKHTSNNASIYYCINVDASKCKSTSKKRELNKVLWNDSEFSHVFSYKTAELQITHKRCKNLALSTIETTYVPSNTWSANFWAITTTSLIILHYTNK